MLHRWMAIVRGLLARRRIEREIDEELAFHLDHEIAVNIAHGMSPEEARRAASRSLGGMMQASEAVRDVRATSADVLWRDLRHAVRSLAAAPGFTTVALLVLTISIGASTAIVSVVDAVVLRGLPFHQADRLVAVGELNVRDSSEWSQNLVAPQNFLDWRDEQSVFTGLAAIGYAGVSLKPEGGQEPETLEAQSVTADFFSVLGTAPLVGRTFTRENEVNGRARVAVISYALWQRRFGGTPDILTRRLQGQQGDFEILGVMPQSFAYPVGAVHSTDVWLPSVFSGEDRVRANSFSYRLQVIGRLRDGISLGQAQAQMDQITAQLAAATPRWFEDRVARVEPLHEYLTRGVRRWMLMLLAAVGGVLLIACVNLATLMLVRVSARSRELTIRAALGASRAVLARALLAEGLLLAFGGAALGALVAWLGVETLRSVIPEEVPRAAGIAVDLRVLAITVGLALVSGTLFSLVPILQSWRPVAGTVVTQVMRTNTVNATHQRLRGMMVTIEVALAAILLVGSGLFLSSYARVSSIDLGMDPRNVLTVRVRPLVGAANWERAQQRHRGLLQEILDEVRLMPGVEAAAFVHGGVPLRGDLRTMDLAIPGRDLPRNEDLDYNAITPEYFRTLGVPLLAGRFLNDGDRQGTEPVAVINQAAAAKYFPGEDPVDRTIHFVGTRRIVGVVGNIRHDGPETDWRRQGFIPLAQSDAVGATLALRYSREIGDVLPRVKTAIRSRFPELALPDVQTLDGYLDRLIAQRRFNMLLLSLFGGLAIVIACVGIYGVMAYVVTQRTHEIGIRMALGAVPAAVLWSVLGRAVGYVGAGLCAGLASAWFLGALVASFLFQTQPLDPWVYVGVSGTLIAAGVGAAYFPARRAARLDPVIALRLE